MVIPRHEASRRLSPSFLLVFVTLLCTAMGLGGIRLYSLYLEHRLSEVSLRIERSLDRNAELERKLSTLLSPQRVYHVARGELVDRVALEVARRRGITAGSDEDGDEADGQRRQGCGVRAHGRRPKAERRGHHPHR